MKKRGFLFLLVILITVKTSFSLEDLVFSDTVYSKDVKQIEGKQFDFKITKDLASVSIDYSGVIIKNGECKIKNNFNICITNISFAYRNATTWEYIYKALVKIYAIKSELTLTKNMPKTELLIDEEVDVELKLENDADIAAENVILSESYTKEFLVSNAEGCSLVFNAITFKGQVAPGQIRICKYKLKGLRPITYKSIAEGSYFDGTEIKAVTSVKTITVLNYSLEVALTTNRDKIAVGDNLNLSLILKNTNKNNDLTITSFVFAIPNGFDIKQKPKGMEQNNNLFFWNGKIEKKGKINFTVALTAARSGKQSFGITGAYKIAEFLRSFNKSYEFDISCNCPYIDYRIGNIVPGLKTDFIVSIKNPGKLNFKNLRIDYFSNIPDIGDFSSAFGTIMKESAIDLIRERIISPAENEKYYFNISIAYESPFNEFFAEKEAIKIPQEKIGEKKVIEEPKEIAVEKEVGVETGHEKNITQKTEEKKPVNKTEEPIVLEEKSKSPWKAIFTVSIIIILLLAFMFIRILKGKKEGQIEVPPEVKAPPELK